MYKNNSTSRTDRTGHKGWVCKPFPFRKHLPEVDTPVIPIGQRLELRQRVPSSHREWVAEPDFEAQRLTLPGLASSPQYTIHIAC